MKPHWILATDFETWRKAEKGGTPKKTDTYYFAKCGFSEIQGRKITLYHQK